jgi:exonuclease III
VLKNGEIYDVVHRRIYKLRRELGDHNKEHGLTGDEVHSLLLTALGKSPNSKWVKVDQNKCQLILDKFEEAGLIDAYREFDPSPGKYTWWDLKTGARERNVGWRIDYFYITKGLREQLKGAYIKSDVQGSDHCPVGIVLKIA